MRYELSTSEWSVIRPMLPNKPRVVPPHRRPSHHFWVLRSGEPWRDLPENFGTQASDSSAPRARRWTRGHGDKVEDFNNAGWIAGRCPTYNLLPFDQTQCSP